jgi:hypothetical protein
VPARVCVGLGEVARTFERRSSDSAHEELLGML